MGKLLALFILVPVVELVLLIEIGKRIGALETLGIIVLTGMIGATLARKQGFAVLRRVQADAREGRIPAGALLDGAIILMAAALLITPGILTDTLGFLCLVPPVRERIRELLRNKLERSMTEHRAGFASQVGESQPPPRWDGTGPIIDVDVEPQESERRPRRP